jgi:ketosteroid isomerase-like protein
MTTASETDRPENDMPIHTMSTPAAHQLVADLFDIIDTENWDELGRVFAQDCVCHPPGVEPLVGMAAIDRYYRHDRPVAAGSHRIDRVVSDIGAAACWGRFTGQSRAGDLLDVEFAEAFLVCDGKIVSRTTYVRRR